MEKGILKTIATGMVLCLSLKGQYLAPPERASAQAHPRAAVQSYVDVPSYKRDMAHLLQDMRVLQEDMRALLTRIEALEAEKARKDALIRELQETVALYERRMQQLEQKQVASENRLRAEVARTLERVQAEIHQAMQKALDSLKGFFVAELARVEQIAVKAANAPRHAPRPAPVLTGSYKEVRVEQGDTLSSIAASAGVSVQTLRQVNGLKNDVIRIGQLLKIPVPQP